MTFYPLCFYCIQPDVQRKLRKELIEAGFDQHEPLFSEIQAEKTPYLESVVNETLRLSRTAGAVNRTATCDTVILGHVIPKGACIFIPMSIFQVEESKGYSIKSEKEGDRSETSKAHLKEMKEWVEGNEFRPERWLDESGGFDRDSGFSTPFSLGQRGCFGKNLAREYFKQKFSVMSHTAIVFFTLTGLYSIYVFSLSLKTRHDTSFAFTVLELKLFMIALNLAFFFESIPSEFDTEESQEFVTRKPKNSFVRPVKWESLDGGV